MPPPSRDSILNLRQEDRVKICPLCTHPLWSHINKIDTLNVYMAFACSLFTVRGGRYPKCQCSYYMDCIQEEDFVHASF